MARFLRQLRSFFAGFIQYRRFRRPPDAVEELTRYIFSKSHFSQTSNRIKPAAFLPAPSPVETSVFRMNSLAVSKVQRLGQQLGARRSQTLHAWASVLAGAVFGIGLQVRPDNRPARHAAIMGWPEEKHERLTLAQQLAAAAALHLPSKEGI